MHENDFSITTEDYYSSSMSISNFSFPAHCDIGNHRVGDFYSFNRIRYLNQTVSNDINSPIMVLGNSYSNTPESISAYLCMKLGLRTYHYAISGKDILLTAIHRIFNNPDYYLKNRKVLILSIGTIHLTANIQIPNIYDLDYETNVLCNSKLVQSIDIPRGESIIPDFAANFDNPIVLSTDQDGICPIIGEKGICSSPDLTEDDFILVYYVTSSYTHLDFRANYELYPLEGFDHPSIWSKKIIPVKSDSFSLEVVGSPNTKFAIGAIQIFRSSRRSEK